MTPTTERTFAPVVTTTDTLPLQGSPTSEPREVREPRPPRGDANQGGSPVSMKALLEAGVHFGHQTKRWNPKMRPYIFTERNGIHIIDLQQTVTGLQVAMRFLSDVVGNGGRVLFVGTKKQAQEAVREEAERAGQFYVNKRWMGGMLTNYVTIRARLKYLADLESRRERGEFALLPKTEALKLGEEIDKLNGTLGGIKEMRDLPDVVFIVDPHRERIAITEAIKLGLPVVAMVDTNCDPDEVDYVIPSNDDAIRAVRVITALMASAIVEGQQRRESARAEEIAAREYAASGGFGRDDDEE